jgi:RimJ/RimL family protein N-acetyltransferase
MPARSDLELLQVEMDLLWADSGPELVVACAGDGVRARIGKSVREQLGRLLSAEIDALPAGTGVGTPPLHLERWRIQLEDALGARVTLTPGSGPSYLIEDDVAFPSKARLIRSDASNATELRAANPGNWGPAEWLDLMDGRLGPWVISMHGARVISICHTPVSNSEAAEAGIWTHPEFRGQGHAAATTAGWAALMRASGRLLFYSVSRTNSSSQAVAARLHLRPIGWLWQLKRHDAAPVC